MSDDLSINRESLLKLLSLVRPALSTVDYIPALKHIRFHAFYATAYNDASAIEVKLPSAALNLGLCVPGEMVIKALGSFNAENVMVQQNEKDHTILITSGRSKIKVPTMGIKDFPLSIPAGGSTPSIELSDDVLTGIQRCLISVGNDPTHPATMGVTLDVSDDGKIVLFSTDNATISRYQTKTKAKLPGDAPVILPTFFCEQLVALKRAYPQAEVEVELHPGALVAGFWNGKAATDPEATLFSKTLVDLTPIDFPKIIRKHCDVSAIGRDLQEIPIGFDAAFSRALLILSAEQDKATKVSVADGYIRLLSTSSNGESSDSLAWGDKVARDPFFVDPALVARGLKACTHLAFMGKVFVMSDKDSTFLHLVSHCSN